MIFLKLMVCTLPLTMSLIKKNLKSSNSFLKKKLTNLSTFHLANLTSLKDGPALKETLQKAVVDSSSFPTIRTVRLHATNFFLTIEVSYGRITLYLLYLLMRCVRLKRTPLVKSSKFWKM